MVAILEARHAVLRREHNDRAWLAWHVAALGRVKKMPKLDRLLRRERATGRRQTPDQMLRIVEMINAAMGGAVTGRNP